MNSLRILQFNQKAVRYALSKTALIKLRLAPFLNSYVLLAMALLFSFCFLPFKTLAQVCVPSSDILITIAQKPIITITGSTTVCKGGNAVLLAELTSGGIGSACTIIWEQSEDDGATWSPIPLENKAMLLLTNLTKSLSFHSIYACEVGTDGCNSEPSNIQKVFVTSPPTVSINPSSSNICENTPVTLTAKVIGGTGSAVYTWYASTDGNNYSPIQLSTNNYQLTINNLTVNTFFKVSVIESGDGCSNLRAISNAVQINVAGCRGSISGFSWLDCNKDGIQQSGEVGLANVPVSISGIARDGTIISGTDAINQTMTNASGLYIFKNLKPGSYTVTFGFPAQPTGINFTEKNRGAASFDSDVDPSGKTDVINLLAKNMNSIGSIDAGFIDNTAPVFTNVPGDVTIECDEPLVFASMSATDNINTHVSITFKDDSIALDCKSAQKFKAQYTRTWSADDGCGNVSTRQQKITTRDTKPPVFNKQPADITIACGDPIPNGADIFTIDACEGKIIPPFTEPYDKICASSGVYHRTFTATDGCNNTASISHNITIVDTVAPIFLNLPNDITLACGASMPEAPTVIITDNCDIAATISRAADDSIPGVCAGSYKIIRHWTAVDACGNTRKGQQIITIFDTESPTIVNVPSDMTVDCKNIPPPISLTVKNNCQFQISNFKLSITDKITTASCSSNYTILRTWVATDVCGNATSAFQKITVKDTTAPVLSNVPTDITVNVGLGEAIPQATIVTATDNCDTHPTVTSNEKQLSISNCQFQIVRTWQAQDVCGNISALQKQTITILDSVTAVRIVSQSKANCTNGSGSVSFSPANYKYLWSDNGTSNVRTNLKKGVYTVTVSKSATCNIVVPVSVDSTVNNLSARYTINKQPTCALNNGSVSINALGGSGNYSYTWGSTNTHSGLSAVTTTVTVTDTQTGCTAATTFSLVNENISATIASDNIVNLACAGGSDGRVNYSISEKSANFAEPAQITIVDARHNSVSNGSLAAGDYTILVRDASGCAATQKSFSVVAPEATSVTIRGENQVCINSSILLESSIHGGTGNCAYQWQFSLNGFNWNSVTPNGTSNTFVVDHLTQKTFYRLQIICGNCATPASNALEVTPIPAPVVSTTIFGGNSTLCAGTKFTINANVAPAQSAYTYQWQTSTDGKNWTKIVGEVSAAFNGVVNSTAQYRVVVTPTTLTNCDVISDPPIQLSISNCQLSIGNYVWLDCNKNGIQDAGEKGLAGVRVNLIGTDDNGVNVSQITATDANGNYHFTNVTSGKYTAIFSAPTGSRGLKFSPKRAGNGINDSKADATGKTDVFTLLASGNIDSIDAGFIDDIKPQFTFSPQDKTIECGKPILFAFSANQKGNSVKIDSVDVINRVALCPIKYTITRTWTATDDCGNSAIISQKINVTDTTPPVIGDIPADISVDCNRVPAPPQNITATDNCDAQVKIIFTEKMDSLCKYTRKITRTWSAVDSCHNFAIPKSQIITIKDSIPPVLKNVPTDITVNAANNETIPPLPTDVYATDNCDTHPSVVSTESPLQYLGNCTGIIKRTWKSVDACGNFNSNSQTITILDAVSDVSLILNTPEQCTATNGRVEFSPVNYTYLWSDGKTGALRNDLAKGDYSVTISKNSNCSVVKTLTVLRQCANSCIPPNVTIQMTNQVCTNGNSGSIQLQITNFISGLSYDVTVKNDRGFVLDTLFKFPVSNLNNLSIGNYILRVQKLGDTTCYNTLNFSIKPAPDVIIAAPTILNADCNTLTGSANFVINDTAQYKFLWNDGDTNRTRKNMRVGNYNVTISRIHYCEAIVSVPIKTTCVQTCVPPVFTIQTTNQTCAKGNDGTATFKFEPLTARYELRIKSNNGYILDTIITTQSTQFKVQGLLPGTYALRVQKLGDTTCLTEKTFSIQPAQDVIVAPPKVIPASCTSPTGSITFSFDQLATSYAFIIKNNNGFILDTTLTAQSTQIKVQGLLPGNYTVTVSDVSGALCPIVIPVIVPTNNSLKTNYVINSQPTCGKPNGYVTLNTTGGSGNYTYSWGEGNSRFVLFAGVTTVTATDRQTGCRTQVTFTLVNQTVGATVAMDSVINLACNGDKNGRLNYIAKGGLGFHFPMTVEVRDSQNNVVNNGALGAGKYVLVVSDAGGCVAAQRNFSVIAPVAAVLTTLIKDQTCDSAAYIQLSITNYQLSIVNYTLQTANTILSGDGIIRNGLFSIDKLAIGTYALSVTDGAHCLIATNNIVIHDVCVCRLPVVDSIVSIPATCGLSNGKATIVLRTTNNQQLTTNNYQYDWSPAAGVPNTEGNARTNISSGVYNVLITANTNADCYVNATVGIGSIDGPKNITYSTKPATCASGNGQVRLFPEPGDSLTYTWLFDGSNATQRNDLKAGAYQVLVSRNTITNCPTLVNVRVESENPLRVTSVVNASATCGANNGAATIISNCQLPGSNCQLIYSWGNNTSRTDLKAGVYTVTVTDTVRQCNATTTFTVNNYQLPIVNFKLLDSIVYTRCADSKDAKINYQLSEIGNQQTIFVKIVDAQGNEYQNENLGVGHYCVLARDANDCIVGSSCFEVRAPQKLNVYATETNSRCDAGGSIIVTTTGGVGARRYSWSDGGTGPLRNELRVGTYAVTVSDANGCSIIIDTLNIRNDCPTPKPCPTISNFEVHITPKTCAQGGSIQLSISNCQLSICNYDWLDIAGTHNSQNRVGLQKGNYTVVITDAQGCIDSLKNIIISDNCDTAKPCTPPTFGNISVIDSRCGKSTGSIQLTQGGMKELRNSNGVLIFSSLHSSLDSSLDSFIPSLPAGAYTLKLFNGADTLCFSTKTIVVANQDGLTVRTPAVQSASCNAPNGAVEFLGTDAGFNYLWSDGKLGSKRTDLIAGSYTITVTDFNNVISRNLTICPQVITITVPSVNNLTSIANILREPSCGSNDGQVNMRISNGSGNYTFSWGPTNARNDLISGNYNVTVSDNVTGCTTIERFTLNNAVAGVSEISLPATIVYTSCAGINDASIGISLKNSPSFAAPARLQIKNEGMNSFIDTVLMPTIFNSLNPTFTAQNLGIGKYTISIFDAHNCLAGAENFEIKSPDAIIVSVGVKNQNCSHLGSIILNTSGGSGFITQKWSNGAVTTNGILDSLKTGTYAVTLTDVRQCAVSGNNIFVGKDSCPTPIDSCSSFKATAQIINKTCDANKNIILGSITVSQTGGTAPYSIFFANRIILDSIKYLIAGNYSVTVSDAKGCADTLKNLIILDKCDTSAVNPTPKILRDTLYRSVLLGKTDTICLTTDTAGTPRSAVTFCNGSIQQNYYFGSAHVISRNCITYTAGSTAGNDRLCLRVCNASSVCTETTIFEEVKRDSARIIPTKSAPFDTLVYVGKTLILCFAPNGASATITPACATRYRSLVSYKINNSNGCVHLTGLSAGRDTLCFSVCRNGICDTISAYILVKPFITPQDTTCEKLYDGPVTLSTICGTPATLCTTLEKDDTLNYRIYDNGSRVSSGFTFCHADTSVSYSYFPLLLNRPSGGWHLDQWIIGAGVHQGNFYTIQALVDSMNVWNPSAQWRLDADALTIFTVKNNYKYGIMLWSRLGLPIAEMEPNTHLEFSKLAIPLPQGAHTIIFENTIRRCSDTVKVTVKCIPGFNPFPFPANRTIGIQHPIVITDFKESNDLLIEHKTISIQHPIVYSAFSPNGDGINDAFTIEDIEKFSGSVLTIYNRWGNQIFEAKDYKNNWEGTYQGAALPDGTYFWMIEFQNKEISTGMVQIRR